MNTSRLRCERCRQPYPADAYAPDDEGRFSGCCPTCWNTDDDAETEQAEAIYRRNITARMRRCRDPKRCLSEMLPLRCTRCGFEWKE